MKDSASKLIGVLAMIAGLVFVWVGVTASTEGQRAHGSLLVAAGAACIFAGFVAAWIGNRR